MNTATIAAPSNVTPFVQNLKVQQPKQQTAKEATSSSEYSFSRAAEPAFPPRKLLPPGESGLFLPTRRSKAADYGKMFPNGNKCAVFSLISLNIPVRDISCAKTRLALLIFPHGN